MRVHVVRWLWPMDGLALGGHVFVKRLSMVPHEAVHCAQQERVGIWLWLLAYCVCLPGLWNPWRLRWEAEAYRVDVRLGLLTKERAAEILSGWLYLKCCSYDAALKALEGD